MRFRRLDGASHRRGGLSVAIEAGNQTAWIHDLLVSLGGPGHRCEPDEGEADRRKSVQDGQDRCEDPVRVAATERAAASGPHAGQAGPGAAWVAGGPAAGT